MFGNDTLRLARMAARWFSRLASLSTALAGHHICELRDD